MRTLLALAVLTASASALDPADIIVVVNKSVPASRAVADHYCTARKVPAANVVELELPIGEDITRADYDRLLAGPLRAALGDRKATVKCLLTVYGVPLRVGPSTPTAAEKAESVRVEADIAALNKQLAGADAEYAGVLNRSLAQNESRRIVLAHQESQAAVDSELMLLWWPPYPTARYLPNPKHWLFPAAKRAKTAPVLLTARLDGPTPEIAKRLADDAVAAEKDGLAGNAYFDARGYKYDATKGGYGYDGYDESFREAAGVATNAGLTVTLDDKPELFAAGACPGAAIYAGWYALSDFRPCCTFTRGAVAWHLASGEAVTLRDAKSKAWCPNLLAAGAAVTLGPVAEPYTVGFPKPAEFFGFLLAGEDSLAEVHAKTQHFVSWMTVLVGDPLYRPFGKSPRLKVADVFPSPKGAAVMFR